MFEKESNPTHICEIEATVLEDMGEIIWKSASGTTEEKALLQFISTITYDCLAGFPEMQVPCYENNSEEAVYIVKKYLNRVAATLVIKGVEVDGLISEIPKAGNMIKSAKTIKSVLRTLSMRECLELRMWSLRYITQKLYR